jgi:hypothetical protein
MYGGQYQSPLSITLRHITERSCLGVQSARSSALRSAPFLPARPPSSSWYILGTTGIEAMPEIHTMTLVNSTAQELDSRQYCGMLRA